MRSRRERGFTLIEILVVVAIMGLLIALIPRLTVGLERVRLRDAADRLALVLTEQHDRALHEGQPVTVSIDTQRLAYAVGEGKPHRLPAVVERLTISWPDAAGPARSLQFFPDGSAAGCMIRLYAKRLSELVAVDWLTGRVRRER